MKIFFLASIVAKKSARKNYQNIIQLLEDNGYKVEADYLDEYSVGNLEELAESGDINKVHKEYVKGIKACDIVVAEVTEQRVGIGYLISHALDLNKPIIVLSRGDQQPFIFDALQKDEKFIFYNYEDIDDLRNEVGMLLDFASDQQDTRFNFFISPKHQNYLDWIAKEKKIPRSVFLRRLIEEHMEENEDYP